MVSSVDSYQHAPIFCQILAHTRCLPRLALGKHDHSPASLRTFLRQFCPEVDDGDHNLAIDLLWNGSPTAAKMELIRLIVYMVANNSQDGLILLLGPPSNRLSWIQYSPGIRCSTESRYLLYSKGVRFYK